MTVNVVVNSGTYAFPEFGDSDWGPTVTSWAVAISAATLQKTGGTFTLTNEADFGAFNGLKSIYYKSRTDNPAVAGTLRLAKTDTVNFRNQDNTLDLPLGINSSNQLIFNGSALSTGANALVGADGITVTSGSSTTTLTGFRTEFVSASGSLQSQITTASVPTVQHQRVAFGDASNELTTSTGISFNPDFNTLSIGGLPRSPLIDNQTSNTSFTISSPEGFSNSNRRSRLEFVDGHTGKPHYLWTGAWGDQNAFFDLFEYTSVSNLITVASGLAGTSRNVHLALGATGHTTISNNVVASGSNTSTKGLGVSGDITATGTAAADSARFTSSVVVGRPVTDFLPVNANDAGVIIASRGGASSSAYFALAVNGTLTDYLILYTKAPADPGLHFYDTKAGPFGVNRITIATGTSVDLQRQLYLQATGDVVLASRVTASGRFDTSHIPTEGLGVDGNATITGTVAANRIAANPGSVSSPAITLGDIDTGLYSTGGGFIGITANGASKLTIDAAANQMSVANLGSVAFTAGTAAAPVIRSSFSNAGFRFSDGGSGAGSGAALVSNALDILTASGVDPNRGIGVNGHITATGVVRADRGDFVAGATVSGIPVMTSIAGTIETFDLFIEQPSTGTITVCQAAAFPFRIDSVAAQTQTNVIVSTTRIAGAEVVGLNNRSYSSTAASYFSTSANTVAVGQKVDATMSGSTGAENLALTYRLVRL